MGLDQNAGQDAHFLVVGPSGSGLTTALDIFSDFGFMQISDMPPAQWVEIFSSLAPKTNRIAMALAVTPQTAGQIDALIAELPALKAKFPSLRLLYLDAPEALLVQRYVNSGKKHPFEDGQGLARAVSSQSKILSRFKELKQRFPNGYYNIDTATHTCDELRVKLAKILGINIDTAAMTVYITSFGFKNGVPADSELVFDMRFLKNPYYVDELRPLTGLDKPVKDYIDAEPATQPFTRKWTELIGMLLPGYRQAGKLRLFIAIGCTGGQHRSVYMAEVLADYLKRNHPGYNVVVLHREKDHWPLQAPRPEDIAQAEPFLSPKP
jgi:RNase adapter protein RapZ